MSREEIDKTPILMLSIWFLTSMSWWALAYWPTTNNQSWLARTQYVCFGKLPGQVLPLSGWILLFGGPVLLLAAFLMVYRSEIVLSIQKLLHQKFYKILLIFFVISFSAELGWLAWRIQQEKEISKSSQLSIPVASHLPEGYPIENKLLPAFSLMDQFGNKITNKSLNGQTVIMSFVFAHCAAVCPMLVRQVNGALEKLEGIKNIKAVLVTLDPWRDRPSSLPAMAEEWQLESNTHLLSGSVKDVVKLHKDFDLPLQKDEKTGDIAHPSLIYVISPEGKIAFTFNNPPIQWIVDAVKKVQ